MYRQILQAQCTAFARRQIFRNNAHRAGRLINNLDASIRGIVDFVPKADDQQFRCWTPILGNTFSAPRVGELTPSRLNFNPDSLSLFFLYLTGKIKDYGLYFSDKKTINN
jgi:hypothetical protein